ncbi:MAG: aspartate kinase, partial [Saprospiraceae bacterium]|nr:aspartate kinase [Saprospiraceae bacterium]
MKVFKFGGASVRDEQSIKNLGSIVKSIIQKEPLVLVISAIGKTTNALEEVVNDFYFNRGDAIEKLQKIKEQHHQIASALGLEQLLNSGVLNDLFVEAEWLLEDEIEDPYDYIYDQIVAIGELLSTRIVQAYLAEKMDRHSIWVDARDVIKTDDCYREGTPDWHNTDQKIRQFIQPALDQQKTVVIAGFIGSTTENNTITLGREGSDFTAAILASLLKAESLTVWKDVPGIMTADPHVFSDAKLLPEIDYREA